MAGALSSGVPRPLGRSESVDTAIRRVARRRIDYVGALLERTSGSGAGRAVHEARKQLKHLRALLRLLEPAMGRKRRRRADAGLREVSGALSPLRDAAVLLATLQRLHRAGAIPTAAFTAMASAVRRRRSRTRARLLAPRGRAADLPDCLRDARRRIVRRSAIPRGWRGIGPGLRRMYRAARAAARALDTPRGVPHEARKRAKDLHYALVFLQPIHPRSIRTTIHATRRLTRCLGEDHDLALLQQALDEDLGRHLSRAELRRLTETVARQRQSLQRQARAMAGILYSRSAEAFIAELRGHWRTWHARAAGPRR